ncbi:uncharacterized protein LOC118438580 isoform X2 [Folsomia candida]|uniref:uncharacterized protein LOC118438580 isoform X2 n=1 Tax=Folsomia candida TaxID=158441 RepID=UPI0016055663|nr:uncharacterized protein LOC118438580 isoform X2 [Folsomia candida]
MMPENEPASQLMKDVMFNHLILSPILTHLDLTSLKAARLVSQFWGKEALSAIRERNLITQLVPPFDEVEEIVAFFSTAGLPHTLCLSFASPAFFFEYVTVEDCPVKSYHFPRETLGEEILRKVGTAVVRNHRYGSLVRELRLEMSYLDEADAAYLAQIMQCFTQVEKVFLNFTAYENPAYLATSAVFPYSVKKLALRTFKEHGEQPPVPLRVLAVERFLSAVENIAYLDLQWWGPCMSETQVESRIYVDVLAALIAKVRK